jgi:hypothetical protein
MGSINYENLICNHTGSQNTNFNYKQSLSKFNDIGAPLEHSSPKPLKRFSKEAGMSTDTEVTGTKLLTL